VVSLVLDMLCFVDGIVPLYGLISVFTGIDVISLNVKVISR
jgi:hypothetical protein